MASVPVWRPEKLFAVARIYLYWLRMKPVDNSATNVECTSIRDLTQTSQMRKSRPVAGLNRPETVIHSQLKIARASGF